MNIISHGDWVRYAPAQLPAGAPANALFCRRISDSLDWYTFARGSTMAADSIKVAVTQVGSIWKASVAAVDASLLFPQGHRLYEIKQPAEPDPAAYTGKQFNPASGALTTYTPVPVVISDRQFFQALAMQGMITEAEALAAVQTGAIPAAMMTLINSLPSNQRFDAKMLLSGAVEFRRDHSLVASFAAANGISVSQTDDLWRFAATL